MSQASPSIHSATDETLPSIGDVEIGRSDVAGQSTDDGKARIFPCERCGADMVFHIGEQKLSCGYCGFVKDLTPTDVEIVEQDFETMLARLEKLHEQGVSQQQPDQNEVRCESCGGTVLFAGTLTSSECPYCGSPIQRDKIHTADNRISVDGVIPFLVDHDSAAKKLADWVKSRWFAPNEFLRRGAKGKFNGVYLPYWTFDTLTHNAYTGERGENYTVMVGVGKNRRSETRTRWYPASGRFQRFFDDVLVVASRGLPAKFILALEPWPLAQTRPFTQEVLAGYLARTYDLELKPGFVDAKQRIDAAIDSDVRRRIGGDQQRVHSIKTQCAAIKFKHLLLPVWMLAYRYQNQPYRVFVNAGTGEVQGERPYSWLKIMLAVIAGLLAAAGGFALTQQ